MPVDYTHQHLISAILPTGDAHAPIEVGTDETAVQALVDASVAALVASAPGSLDTLNELAAALGDDANFAATITNALAGKQPLDEDLTAIAALTTTSFGRGLLALADAAALLSAAGAADSGHTHSVSIAIPFIIDGGGSTITTGIKGDLVIPFACTITEWTLLADQSGSIAVDIWKDTYANYPPTNADSITDGGTTPAISSATKNQSSTLTGWTTSISAGDTLRFNVDSVTTIQRVTMILKATRTI